MQKKPQQCQYDKANILEVGYFLFVFLEKKKSLDGRKAMNIKEVLLNSGAVRHHGSCA